MSYILDGLTLPQPKGFTRKQIETGKTLQLLDGTTKKDITNRKEQYVLLFQKLTQAEIALILTKYNLLTTLSFQVTETNLTIAATTVHMELLSRKYLTKGNEYREDITLILTEVV